MASGAQSLNRLAASATTHCMTGCVMLVVPGAMEAGLGDVRFWATLAAGLAVAWVVAYPLNRWLIARGRGHAVVHSAHMHDAAGVASHSHGHEHHHA